jgi:hypothetical protein
VGQVPPPAPTVRRAACCPQLHGSTQWDSLVEAAFKALDLTGAGRIGRADLERVFGDQRRWKVRLPAARPPQSRHCRRRGRSSPRCHPAALPSRAHATRQPPAFTDVSLRCGALALQVAQSGDQLDGALLEAGVGAGGSIDLPQFRGLMTEELHDTLHLFEPRIVPKPTGREWERFR